ncbi:MAG: PhoD-like phosphatase N-terminal domain-containing protein, partial [Salinisphaeraceae bacterium]|nr:PhoD-like phosphatase N-terminal domain-containing protein [Salinisphaeraceae bacterium]
MKKITRRELIKGAGLIGIAPLLPACGSDSDDDSDSGNNGGVDGSSFQHSVASGDPLSDRVILWTRVTPPEGFSDKIAVSWEIASDEQFTQVLQSGTVQTGPERDFTVKVDPTGLSPATTYYYRFKSGEATSPVGRTKTTPAGMVPKLRFAVASCSNYGYGFFHAYRRIAERDDLDAVFHLGDYIYEYG